MKAASQSVTRQLIATRMRNLRPALLYGALCILSIGLAFYSLPLGILFCLVCAGRLLHLCLRGFEPGSTLTLARGGFSLSQSGTIMAYEWSEVDKFSIVRGYGKNYVTFRLETAAAVRERCSSAYFPDDYGLGTEGLRILLNQWKASSSGNRS